MAAVDIPKTAITTLFGMFEYLYMPFGLKNVAQTFKQLMDRIFCQLSFLFSYLDNHLIASRMLEEHHKHLRQFFEILDANGLQINPEKCVFVATAMDFLGHRVTAEGCHPPAQAPGGSQATTRSSRCEAVATLFGPHQFLPAFLARHRRYPEFAHRRPEG
jgi:Reverse transcriptase (RNA-dependent DNA polymerase)